MDVEKVSRYDDIIALAKRLGFEVVPKDEFCERFKDDEDVYETLKHDLPAKCLGCGYTPKTVEDVKANFEGEVVIVIPDDKLRLADLFDCEVALFTDGRGNKCSIILTARCKRCGSGSLVYDFF